MAVQLAQSVSNARRKMRQHQHAPVRPQDPTLEEQAALMGKRVAAEKAQEMASPYMDSIWTSVKDKVNPYIQKGVDGVKAAFTSPPKPAPGPLTGNMANAATANIGPGGGPTLANVATGIAPEGATAAEIAAGAGKATGIGAAPTTAATTGAMSSIGAVAPWLIGGYFGGKALGLFNKGGPVKGPLSLNLTTGGPISKVKYKQGGGPVNEEIEISYGGPLSNKGA